MSEPKFTPGPWMPHVAFNETDGCPEFCVDLGKCATRHDMKLIAAAPELYEALELALPYLLKDTSSHGKANYWTAKDALAKARGDG